MSSYYLTKLKKDAISWINMIMSAAINVSICFSIAVAYVVANRQALPSEKMENLSDYYRLMLSQNVRSTIYALNEIMAIDVALIEKLAEAFFNYRYYTAFPPALPLAVRKDRGINDFFGLTKYFSDDVLTTINTCPDVITNYVNKLTVVIAQLNHEVPVEPEMKDVYVA